MSGLPYNPVGRCPNPSRSARRVSPAGFVVYLTELEGHSTRTQQYISIISNVNSQGQANVWFAEGREKNKLLDDYLKKIVDQIENYKGKNWGDAYPEG